MDPTRLVSVTHLLIRMPSRRTALRSLLAAGLTAGWLPGAPVSFAKKQKKKRKKKHSCPECVCPAPPAAPFCAGKNTCAQGAPVFCQHPEAPAACECVIRVDTGESICGTPVGSAQTSCPACEQQGLVCVVLSGFCPTGFICVTPCEHPL